jgi:hypothetical protein
MMEFYRSERGGNSVAGLNRSLLPFLFFSFVFFTVSAQKQWYYQGAYKQYVRMMLQNFSYSIPADANAPPDGPKVSFANSYGRDAKIAIAIQLAYQAEANAKFGKGEMVYLSVEEMMESLQYVHNICGLNSNPNMPRFEGSDDCPSCYVFPCPDEFFWDKGLSKNTIIGPLNTPETDKNSGTNADNSSGPSATTSSLEPASIDDKIKELEARKEKEETWVGYINGERVEFPKELRFPRLKPSPDSLEEIRKMAAEKKRLMEARKKERQDSILYAHRVKRNNTDSNCRNSGLLTYLIGTRSGDELCASSIHGQLLWTIWLPVNGTRLSVRFSRKKRCMPDSLLGNSLFLSMESFFDYAFIQFRNNAADEYYVKLKLTYKNEDGSYGTEDWSCHLNGFEIEKDDPGGWYKGCELISIEVVEYCTYH